jgi:hypothetical protein
MNTLTSNLDACAAHNPRYHGQLADHLPMALHALHSLGASPAQLAAFTQRYKMQLSPRGTWPAFEAAWLALGEAHTMDELLCTRLDALMPTAGADAFHALIRLGHAKAAAHLGEARMAVAYWQCSGFEVLGDAPESTAGELELADWLALLHSLPALDSDLPMISQRMRAYAARTDFRAAAPRLKLEAGGATQALCSLAKALAARYAENASFTVLHGLTSSLALHELLPFVHDKTRALRHYSLCVAVALCSDAERFAVPQTLAPMRWEDAIKAAQGSADEHCIKGVYSAWRWNQQAAAPEFLAAAARAVVSF